MRVKFEMGSSWLRGVERNPATWQARWSLFVSSRASIGAEQEEQELVEVFSSMLDKSMPAGRAEPGWRSGEFGEVGKDEEVKEKIRVLARASAGGGMPSSGPGPSPVPSCFFDILFKKNVYSFISGILDGYDEWAVFIVRSEIP